MILSHRPARGMSLVSRLFVLVMILALPIAPAVAQDAAAQKDEELRQLRDRVRQLEERLDRAEKELAAVRAVTTQPAGVASNASVAAAPADAAPTDADVKATDAQRAALKLEARARSGQDARKYKPEQLADAEQLYQVANKNWRAPEAITSLKQMIDKYPDVNRTGCAVLYLGQMSVGDTREEYLKRAVEKHSDCYYFNGVQVGGFGRFLLAGYYKETGKPEEAKRLLQQLVSTYPDAITHGGQRLAPAAKQELATLAAGTAPAGPAAK